MASEAPWRGLHPLSLVVNLIPQAWATARGLWPVLFALVIGGGAKGVQAIDLALIIGFFLLTLSRTLVHFLTLRYRVQAGRFEVRVGLFSRSARVLDPARIQNVELVQNLFHKAAGLVELRVETAGDASSHGLLSALDVGEAERLRAELRALVAAQRPAAAAPPAGDENPPPLLELNALEIIAYGLSRRTVGTVAVLTALGLEVFGRLGPQVAEKAQKAMTPQVLLPAVVLAFAGSWLWSAGSALLRHWRYRLWLSGGELITEEGLTTRRRAEIPRQKLQIVRADEPLLRRIMGYGSLLFETAALGVADGRLRQAEGVAPMVPLARLGELCRVALPALRFDPWQAALLPAHPRALYRAVLARTFRNLALSALLIGLFPRFGWASVVFVLAAPPLAYLDWRWQGWRLSPGVVLARTGFFTRSTWVVSRDKIQSVAVVQGPLMRHHGLGRVIIRVAGTAVALPDVGIDEAHRILQELSPEGA